MKKENNEYILGTDFEELQRLGLQHQVWASEAQQGWKLANFTQDMTLLDLGCGPGFCTKELAYLVGEKGKVIAVDKSKSYIEHVNKISSLYNLNITAIESDFDKMKLSPISIDGVYCRWALAWISNPKEILLKIKEALKPGGKIVMHEYYDWSTHQTYPHKPNLKKAIAGCLQSFRESSGNIDIGKELPHIITEAGMRVVNIRPMSKLATPSDLSWNWPKSFYKSYFPRIVNMGYINEDEAKKALQELYEIEQLSHATLFCPFMVEVIAEKI